jgi:hypothetical protein
MTELSPHVLERLELTRNSQDTYRPNEAVSATLADRELIMLIGPAAVGKSFLIDELTKRHEDFGKVRSFATRSPRPDDTSETMTTIQPTDKSLMQILDDIDRGEVVNYSVHPTTQALYGTYPDSYPSTYNLLPTLASSTTALEAAPFRAHHTIGLVASIGSWDAWFEKRSFASSVERRARLTEAALSLDWVLAQPDVTIVVNQRGEIERAIRDIEQAIDSGGYSSDHHEAWAYGKAEELSEHIEELIHCRCQSYTI